MARFANLRRISALDPVTDHQEIMRISAGLEFPWDYQKALEMALFRTYCVPTISGLLERTGEFERRPQKRYDDTAVLMAELVEHGYDSARGREALRVVNRQHGRYDISNADMLYVLSTFIYDPIDWLRRYGWRPLTHNERLAAFHFYRAVGARMGIREIPAGYDEFLAFKTAYEQEHFVFAPSNRRIGQYTLDLFCSWYPSVARPVVSRAVVSMLDEHMVRAFGFTAPPAWVGAAGRLALRLRAAVVRRMPVRREVKLTSTRNRTYPGYPRGYRPSDLGASSSTAL
ncbi:oxygenase MpaB family protein [Lentzea sp. DG1S-22]|uniref:oxygenase MpaB family protein n=1 Tax=Lentzea sp. DG1S-22 TaxID=3108822 RepID=UPI002E75DF2F|nr:oxygenase MpaB family protein [Lentzea sp. DG1S-22]WVH77389.1 oxygenase MpaB family protein [Lentzea sp. DG1S-22]